MDKKQKRGFDSIVREGDQVCGRSFDTGKKFCMRTQQFKQMLKGIGRAARVIGLDKSILRQIDKAVARIKKK